MKCYLCGSTSNFKRSGNVRDNSLIDILECNSCGLVFLSKLDHTDAAHYVESGMHGDVLISVDNWLKETDADDQRRYDFLKSKLINKKLLDFGCGVGGFLLKSRSLTTVSEGIELERRLRDHFQENNLKVWNDLQELTSSNKKFDIITVFHVVEHLNDPKEIIRQLSAYLTENGEMIIEVPSANDALLTLYKSEPFANFTYWSQHLYLFNNLTLAELIAQSGLKLNWLKQVQRYPLSNHLHWLANGKPGGHMKWSFLDNEELKQAYESQLASLGLCDTIIAGVSLK